MTILTSSLLFSFLSHLISTIQPTTSSPTVSPSLSPVTSKPTGSPSASPVTDNPTPSPKAMDDRTIYCGASNQCNAGNEVVTDIDAQHVVRCCSENGALNWQDSCSSISGVFTQSKLPQCYNSKTFNEALEICSAYNGGRLCSGEEILDGCTSDMGCAASSYDCAANCQGLTSTFDSNNRQYGNYFKIKATQDVYITGFTIHTVDSGTGTVKIYEKEGDYEGFVGDSGAWNLIMNDSNVNGQGVGRQTSLDKLDVALFIPAGTFRSFHIGSSLRLEYTNGSSEGRIYAQNDDIIFYEGLGVNREFGSGDNVFSPRVWNGILEYGLDNTLVWGCTADQDTCTTDAECCAGICNGGVCGTNGPTNSPSPAPTPLQTIPPTMPQLERVGNDGIPESVFPLQQCQGDCDDDLDCFGKLQCIQRDAFEEVLGCAPGGESGTDYCSCLSLEPPSYEYTTIGQGTCILTGVTNIQGPSPLCNLENVVVQFYAFGDTPYDKSSNSCYNEASEVFESSCSINYRCNGSPASQPETW